MELKDRIALFRNMVSSCYNLYLWTYDCAMHLQESNCPEEASSHTLLMVSVDDSDFLAALASANTPLLVSNQMEMMWLIQPYMEEKELLQIYVLGPFFTDDISTQNLETLLIQHHLPPALREKMHLFLHSLPIIAWGRVQEYAIMLHRCVMDARIAISDLRFYKKAEEPVSASRHGSEPLEQPIAHGTYRVEQEMLRMVREGDMRLIEYIEQAALVGNIGKLSNGDPIRQLKNATLVCTTLFSRAAIDGGLEPELSYTLTDRYFQAVEACKTYSEINEITRAMQADFVQRVHHYKMSKYSHAVQQCCDHISLHLEDEITLEELAKLTGYATYYLSKKFKKETGSIPADYIRRQRLARAAWLLRTTHEDVQTISERLQFGTQSYFSDSFRKEYGMTPTEYRQQNT